jgi:cell shape-determining protein MreD
MALFTPFNFMLPDMPFLTQCVGYISIFGGAMLWWLFITYVVNKLRLRFDVRGIWIINRVIGVIVMLCSLVGVVLIATGTWSFHYECLKYVLVKHILSYSFSCIQSVGKRNAMFVKIKRNE